MMMNPERLRSLSLLATLLGLTLFGGLIAGCGSTAFRAGPTARPGGVEALQPPAAAQRPHPVTAPHGPTRTDPFYWLRDREDPEVLAYLRAENDYADAAMGHTAELQQRLFEEFRARTRENDESVPYRLGSYWYYSRHEEGKEHPIYARRKGSMDAPEEIILDANERALGHPFYRVSWEVSSGEDILAFAEDTLGRNLVTIRFKDLRSGKLLEDVIPDVSWNMAWAEDNRTLFFTAREPVTLRMDRVYRHELGRDPAAAELVWEERDEIFSTFVTKTRSRAFIVIGSSHTLAHEYRFVRADRPDDPFELFLPRERGHEHWIDHAGDHFYIRTNDGALDFRIVRTPVDRTGREFWEEVLPHREGVLVHGFTLFQDHMAVLERDDGQLQIRIRHRDEGTDHLVAFEEAAYLVAFEQNPEFDTAVLRVSYESLAVPPSIYDYHMDRRELTLLKQEEVLGDWEPARYRTERRTAPARDGARIPVTMVYRRDLRQPGPQPLLLYGYGAYGASRDPWFSVERLSLLDRGMVFAIAHVRGGQELGRAWYDDGRLHSKLNTFYDFIDVAEHLVKEGYTSPDRLFADGLSAGGLLIGAVVTMRPNLFHAALARVPFVDVVTTMLDESIPLTTFEYDEWGDPRDPVFYETMLSYSPYDNVREQEYPHLLVTSGLHDSQVQFWEPTKWVARLRATATGDSRLLLHTNMEAGHGGAAGRYQRWREIAFQYAFLLDLAGLTE